MSNTTTDAQAIMFEPTSDEPQVRASRADEAGGVDEVGGVSQAGRGSAGPELITFEQGYEELKQIVARLDDPELPIYELFEGFRRGMGLEKTLRAYLQEREGELVELEEGNNLTDFEIVAPSNGS